MRFIASMLLLIPSQLFSQHDHHPAANRDVHLSHILACRQQTVYIHDVPPPQLLDGIGKSGFHIQTSSEKTQQFFNKGVALLHCFWDFEAYRAFKESIRHDSSAIMPYWGLLETVGSFEKEEHKKDRALALKKLKTLTLFSLGMGALQKNQIHHRAVLRLGSCNFLQNKVTSTMS